MKSTAFLTRHEARFIESNANELEQKIFLISIRFGTWDVPRLNRARVFLDDNVMHTLKWKQGWTINYGWM